MLPTVFGDGVIDVHVASGVARITLGSQTGAKDAKPVPSAVVIVPVLQLPNLARVLTEVTKQIEAKAKEAMAPKPTEPEMQDQVAGAFRFNG